MQLHRISKERSQHRILEVEAAQVVCPRQGIVDMNDVGSVRLRRPERQAGSRVSSARRTWLS
jgi:hypothetical protein